MRSETLPSYTASVPNADSADLQSSGHQDSVSMFEARLAQLRQQRRNNAIPTRQVFTAEFEDALRQRERMPRLYDAAKRVILHPAILKHGTSLGYGKGIDMVTKVVSSDLAALSWRQQFVEHYYYLTAVDMWLDQELPVPRPLLRWQRNTESNEHWIFRGERWVKQHPESASYWLECMRQLSAVDCPVRRMTTLQRRVSEVYELAVATPPPIVG